MKLTALSIALTAAIGLTAGCSTQSPHNQSSASSSFADAQSQYALGRFYQGQERYELAIESYRRALAVNPEHVDANNGLGASLLLTGRTNEAIEQFKTALKHQPRSPALWNNLGYAYSLGGEPQLAEMAYKQSLDLDPGNYKTNTNLAMAQQATPKSDPASTLTAQLQEQTKHIETVAVETHSIPVYSAHTQHIEEAPAKAAIPEPVKPALSTTNITVTQPVTANIIKPISAAQASLTLDRKSDSPQETTVSKEPALKPQTVVEVTETPVLPPSVQIAKVAPRVYEVNLRDTNTTMIAATQLTPVSAGPAASATNISIPLREVTTQTASADQGDFTLEIRNGNGVRHLAFQTSQYLAGQGYTTKRLSNEPGFNVRVTQVLYLPGYLEEAKRLLSHLPKDTELTETANLRHGTHVRVVLGKDMEEQQVSLESAGEKIRLASL